MVKFSIKNFKIFKILFRNFLPPNRSTLFCSNVVKKIFRRKIGEVVRYLPIKNSAPSQTVATERIAPKICQGQSPTLGSHGCKFHPNRFTFGRVIVERVNFRSFVP